MSIKIDELGKKLHAKLDSGIDQLKKAQDGLESLEKETKSAIDGKLDSAKNKVNEKKQDAKATKDKVEKFVEEKKSETAAAVNAWKAERNLKKLEKRAEHAAKQAESCIELALYSSQEAEVAILEALSARLDLEDAIEKS
jgi:formate-dependent nitrite reductase cytochrome c552 subunit